MSENNLDFLSNYKRIKKQFWGEKPSYVYIRPNPKSLLAPEPEPEPEITIDFNEHFPDEPDSAVIIGDDFQNDTVMLPGRAVLQLDNVRMARAIIRDVAEHFGVKVEDILSFRRTSMAILPRHLAMWRIRNETLLSMPRIGLLFSGRDPTTIGYAVKEMDRAMANRGIKNWKNARLFWKRGDGAYFSRP